MNNCTCSPGPSIRTTSWGTLPILTHDDQADRSLRIWVFSIRMQESGVQTFATTSPACPGLGGVPAGRARCGGNRQRLAGGDLGRVLADPAGGAIGLPAAHAGAA